MHQDHDLNRLTAEIAALETETFQIADYADVSEMHAVVPSCATSCSATSTVGA